MCDLFTGRTADTRRLIVDGMREICLRPTEDGGLGMSEEEAEARVKDCNIPLQVGVGLAGGAEVAVQLLSEHLRRNPGHAVASDDKKNGFILPGRPPHCRKKCGLMRAKLGGGFRVTSWSVIKRSFARRSNMYMRSFIFALSALTVSALNLPAHTLHPSRMSQAAPAIHMRVPDARSKSRESLLPDLRKALSEVSLFIAKADASRQRKPLSPSADCIEQYCAYQQRKLDLLMAEAKILRDCEEAEGCDPERKVRWSDIDGNDFNDAAWLKR